MTIYNNYYKTTIDKNIMINSGGSLEEATEATPPRDFRKKIKINYYLKNIYFSKLSMCNVCL